MTTYAIRHKYKQDNDRGFTFQVCKVTDQGGLWQIKGLSGYLFTIDKALAHPRVFDFVTVWTSSLSEVRGVDLNGRELFYYTPKEWREKTEADDNAWRNAQRVEYESLADWRSSIYAKLPDMFQQRIDRFRTANRDFWMFEVEELKTCIEAVNIAKGIKKNSRLPVQHYRKDDNGQTAIPVDIATVLAYLYVKTPQAVVTYHGALCAIWGCSFYACGMGFANMTARVSEALRKLSDPQAQQRY